MYYIVWIRKTGSWSYLIWNTLWMLDLIVVSFVMQKMVNDNLMLCLQCCKDLCKEITSWSLWGYVLSKAGQCRWCNWSGFILFIICKEWHHLGTEAGVCKKFRIWLLLLYLQLWTGPVNYIQVSDRFMLKINPLYPLEGTLEGPEHAWGWQWGGDTLFIYTNLRCTQR